MVATPGRRSAPRRRPPALVGAKTPCSRDGCGRGLPALTSRPFSPLAAKRFVSQRVSAYLLFFFFSFLLNPLLLCGTLKLLFPALFLLQSRVAKALQPGTSSLDADSSFPASAACQHVACLGVSAEMISRLPRLLGKAHAAAGGGAPALRSPWGCRHTGGGRARHGSPSPCACVRWRCSLARFAARLKFMREVTPYIKKPSLVSDLPWDGAAPQSPSLSGSEDSGSPKHHGGAKDRKVIPLKMCFAARNLSMPDLENRLIELHSPDSRNTLILRCKDTATAHSWFTALHTNIAALLPQVLAELNATLGTTNTTGSSKEVKHIAWLAEQVGDEPQWRPVLMAVTEKDLLLYDSMPWTRDAWASPCHSYPLVATRLVHSGSGRRSPCPGSELTFATRTGSRQGIEMHVFRVETHRDLSSWTRILVQGCHAAAELIKEVSVGCTFNGQEVKLCIHYESGFTIAREETGGSVLFRYPYEKLKMSADDGIRNLYLDFGGPEGELALDLHSCPKPIVFVLHTFLSAKVTRMGLLV
uniref:Syntrophin beta 2 n=1 Tax=Apteryx owenii TaxID=8824 RepID=A0A8B9NWI3_APTOW